MEAVISVHGQIPVAEVTISYEKSDESATTEKRLDALLEDNVCYDSGKLQYRIYEL